MIGRTIQIPPSQRDNAVNSASILNDREWAEQQAQKQMDFQERMSNTSYQRAIDDLRKSGLNPALAYQQGGASTTTGAQAFTDSTSQKKELKERELWFGLANNIISTVGNIVGKKAGATTLQQFKIGF